MPKTRVLVVDDSLTLRRRLVAILASDPEIELIGEAEDGKRAIEICQRCRPDVVTMDRARLAGLRSRAPAAAAPMHDVPSAQQKYDLVAIGASTGGPGAIVDILRGLPAAFQLPILFVLHINEPFGAAFAEWLDAQTGRRVVYPQDGAPVSSAVGRVAMAPGGRHLVVRDRRLRLTLDPERNSCRPSVDLRHAARGGRARRRDRNHTPRGNRPPVSLLAIRGHGGPIMSGRVLVVDDSLTVRMNLKEMLDAADLPAVACATVAEARQALAQERFDLVILDVLLPDGDGIQLLEEIRATPSANRTATAVILLSTESELRDRMRGLTTGADEYVGKPYEPSYVVARARELTRHACATAPPAAVERILVIDDSVTFREELQAALEYASYRVVVAGSGEEGLRLASDLRPAAIIVDGVLPGIDGATVIRRIRLDAALRRLPCLLLTASEESGAEIRALDAGADAFVRKGDDITVILAKLNAMLRSSGAQTADLATTSLLGPKKVLAVDDSETYLQELAGALCGDGYEIVLAYSGEEALQLLAAQPVDCVLLDLLMPGIGGLETCRCVKSAPAMRDIPIVMLTAVEDRNAMIEGLGAGADDYIAKSSDFDVLRARVFAQIRRKQFEDENRRIHEQLLLAEMEALEARTARELAETRAALVTELEAKNEELESFSHSVAHDLRAPLRSIDGFGQALLEDYADILDEEGKQYLHYVRESTQQMTRLIDDLLALSHVTRGEFQRAPVDLGAIARTVAARLAQRAPERQVELVVAAGLVADGDGRLLTIVFENLLGNAWKFTGKRAQAQIEVGITDDEPPAYFVRDNGAGFDMAYAAKLFGMFRRLHSADEFEGTGIGLTTVQRVIRRHGGRVWADGAVGRGATFFFTLHGGARPGIPVASPGSSRANNRLSAGTQW
jgi:two-component system, NtrC family, sensor kinase